MKKDTYYFSHDFGARNDPKLQNVLMAHGAAGLGVFWCIVEQLYEQEGFLSLSFCKTIAYTLHVDITVVESIVRDFDLFKYDDERFWSVSVNARLKKRNDANESRRQKKIAYYQRLRQQQDKSQSTQSQVEDNSNMTSKKECKDNDTITEAARTTTADNKDGKDEIKPIQKKRTIFTPPTLEAVKAYVTERQSTVDPTAFWNFYESKGWMVGSNKMKNWKAAISTWERHEKHDNGNKVRYNQGGSVPANGRGVTLPDGTRFD